ncbi:MAG: hypothetical protein U9P88_00190 [Patescibacteria group bacterium]|nr:hypothetical protein [Patescibacteria group bacterium]
MPKIIISIIIIGSVIGAGVFVLFPKCKEINAIRGSIQETKKNIQAEDEYFAQVQEVLVKTQDNVSAMAKIDSAIPSTPSVPCLLDFFQKQASRNGLVLEDMSFSVQEPKKVVSPKIKDENKSSKNEFPEDQPINQEGEGLKKIMLDISLFGNYADFKKFLGGIEKTARMIETRNISFSSPGIILKKGVSEKAQSFSFKINVETYALDIESLAKQNQRIKINWNVLEDSRLEKLLLFEKVPLFDGELGRENPFIPY